MYYLIGAGLLFIISIIVFIQAQKKEKLTIEEAAGKHKRYIGQLTKKEQEEYEQLVKSQVKLKQDCQALEKQREYEQARAKEAHDATEQVLLAEHERARAELKGVKELELEKMRYEMQEKQRALNAEYNAQELYCSKNFAATLEIYQEELAAAKNELDEFQAKRAAVNEAIRREEELQNEIDSHRIILSDVAKEDIRYLISIEPNIHNKELLHKLIWSEYLQTPFNDMLKKIFGSKIPKNVIYCIENIKLHKKYIGKTSAEVSKRWTEHIKSSLSIGGIKHQNIHDALFEHWDEFTFSIMEEVVDNKLSEREKYYINFFETDKFGYNQKGGG